MYTKQRVNFKKNNLFSKVNYDMGEKTYPQVRL